MKPRVLLTVLLLTCIRAAAVSAQHHPVDAVGRYEIAFEMDGQSQTGVLTITKHEQGRLQGTLQVHGQEVALDSVTVNGNELTLNGTHTDLTLTFRIHHDGRIEGTFSHQGSSGAFSGVRQKKH